MLWRALTLPNFSGAGLHGYLDGTMAAPAKTIVQGTGAAATTIANPAYATWWTQDQRVLGLLLGSISPEISCQLIGKNTAAAVWEAVHSMFGAQSRANVRHLRRQIQGLKRLDAPAGEYMNKVRVLADTMAAAGEPLSDDAVIDYMLTGLGPEFNPLAASMIRDNSDVSLSDFYSHVLSYESMIRAQQADAQVEDWSSSANAVSRPGPFSNTGQSRPSNGYSTGQGGGGGRPPAGGPPQQGQVYNNYRPSDNSGGGQQNHGGGGRNGGNGRNRQRPRCQLCNIWGHVAGDCRNRYNPEFKTNTQRSGNAASTSTAPSSTDTPPWLMDSGATDHLTSHLERLQFHDRYGGKDQVHVANGAGLSISHIGHSSLAGSSLQLKNILHVPHISKNLLSVYRLVSDNDVFVEFHRTFFCVKDKATRKVLLHGRSEGGLYPIPFRRASSSSPPRHALSAKVSTTQWHQRLGHPANNVVQTIVRQNNLSCSSSDNPVLVCDACQRGKSHQLSYSASYRVSTMPLELVHSDVWGQLVLPLGGTSIT